MDDDSSLSTTEEYHSPYSSQQETPYLSSIQEADFGINNEIPICSKIHDSNMDYSPTITPQQDEFVLFLSSKQYRRLKTIKKFGRPRVVTRSMAKSNSS